MNKILQTLLLTLLFTRIIAQEETSKWYFGYKAGLDFSTVPPTFLNNSAMYSNYSSGSIADEFGNLLFYTNGDTVWNRQHQIMLNGTGLQGKNNLIIVKKPASSQYYIFTIETLGPLRYSIVDMTLATGNGSVLTKNVQVFSPCVSKLAATKHCNGNDIWIVTHEWNSNNFQSYLLTASGLQITPVVTGIGTAYTCFSDCMYGQMRISPNGKKLGLVIPDPINVAELYDFDSYTGVVSNSLALASLLYSPQSCEFSADGGKFYCVVPESAARTYQYDLCSGNNQYLVSNKLTPLQLAQDGKIYSILGYNSNIDAINHPSIPGVGCDFSTNALSIAPRIHMGTMPCFMSSYFKYLSPINYSLSSCGVVNFSTSVFDAGLCSITNNSVIAVNWDFGDTWSDNNFSTSANPSHTYSASGTYTVKIIVYNRCAPDTLKKLVLVPSCLGLAHTNEVSSLRIYPNPASDMLNVELGKLLEEKLVVQVYNIMCELIEEINFEGVKMQLDIHAYKSGMYFIKLLEKGRIKSATRFVKTE